jgi:hypothetical protein
MSIKIKGKFFSDTELENKQKITKKQKKKIFEKYTKHFSDFLNGEYKCGVEKACVCEDEEECDCSTESKK